MLNRNCTMLLRAQLNLFTVHLCTCAKLQTIYLGHVFIWCQENGRTMNKCTKSNVFLFLTLFSECKKILSVPRRRKRQSANVNKDRLRRCLDGWLKVFLYSIAIVTNVCFLILHQLFLFFQVEVVKRHGLFISDPDNCQPNPCNAANSVGCEDKFGSFACICRHGFSGKRCEISKMFT